MLIKVLFPNRAASLEEYRKTVAVSVRVFCGMAVLGLVTLAVTLLLMNGQVAEEHDTAYMQGVWCGIGSGLIAAGAIMALRTRRLLKDEAALRKAMLEAKDERNIAINQKAVAAAAGIGLVLLYLVMLIVSFFDRTTFQVLSACAMGFILLFFAARAFYQRRM